MFDLLEPSLAIIIGSAAIAVVGLISVWMQNKHTAPKVSTENKKTSSPAPKFYWVNSKKDFIPCAKDFSGFAHDDSVLRYRNHVCFERLNRSHEALFSHLPNNPIYSKILGCIGDYYEHSLSTPWRIIVAKLDKEIIGALVYVKYKQTTDVIVRELLVSPVHRYKGVGSGLMKKLRMDIGPKPKIQLQDASMYDMPWMNEVFKDRLSYTNFIFFKKSKHNSAGFYHKLNKRDASLDVRVF